MTSAFLNGLFAGSNEQRPGSLLSELETCKHSLTDEVLRQPHDVMHRRPINASAFLVQNPESDKQANPCVLEYRDLKLSKHTAESFHNVQRSRLVNGLRARLASV